MLWLVSSRDGWWIVSLVNEMLRAAVQHGTRGRVRLLLRTRRRAQLPSAVNLKFLSLLAASSFRNFKFKTALES